MATTPDGDTIAIGQVGITPTAIGGYEKEFGWIARLNSDGEVLWERTLGERGALHGFHSIVPLSDDSVLIAGWTGLSSHESDDGTGWLERVTANGQMDWEVKPASSVTGVLSDDEGTGAIVVLEDEMSTLEALKIDQQHNIVPVWEHAFDAGNIWTQTIFNGVGKSINLSVSNLSDSAERDTI